MSETQRSLLLKHNAIMDSHAAQWTAIALVLKNAAEDAIDRFKETIAAAKKRIEAEQAARTETVQLVVDIISFGGGKLISKVLPAILIPGGGGDAKSLGGRSREKIIEENKELIGKVYDSPIFELAQLLKIDPKEMLVTYLARTKEFHQDYSYDPEEPLACFKVLHESVALEEARVKKQMATMIGASSTTVKIRRHDALKIDQLMGNTFLAHHPNAQEVGRNKKDIANALETGLWRDYVSGLSRGYSQRSLPAGVGSEEVATDAAMIHPICTRRIQMVTNNLHFTEQDRNSRRIIGWLIDYFARWRPPEKLIGKSVLPPGVAVPWKAKPVCNMDPRYCEAG